ncbi:hypothetical protein SAMN05421835_110173 [Amycolatopsis sacchari]|uniref:Uncharacterized protein n=1 Tax=Amycolatopsis sacchari TaxID=115433 RepID=A0A1I3V7F4_9PSEU|nr:hypothetical protein [Amycolatopsis sacchari]SFJ91082.1 hypothetical protein SAMN05421835_110173 [Amycolatopsis sacchari]
MAKNTFPPIKTGTSLLTKVVGLLTLIAILTLVVKHPTDAATWLSQAGHFVGTVIDGIASFLQHALG